MQFLSPEALGPRSRIVDRATEVLREAILTGELRPGQILIQSELAKRLRVSRTPLREALRRLEEQGLVTLNANSQASVRPQDPEYVFELYRLREAIDGLAARLCAERIAREGQTNWIEDLDRILEQMRGSVLNWQPQVWSHCNVRFHVGLLEASLNRPLQGLTATLRMSAEMFYPSVLLYPERAGRALQEHLDILAAIRSGDPTAAEELARHHIRAAIQVLRRSGPDYVPRVPGRSGECA